MIYRDYNGIKLSQLAMGNMRLPTLDGDESKIDEKQVEEMFDYAIRNGVNYFDTAWVYHRGQSEIVVGKILQKYPRDSFYLATKFPGFDRSNMERVKEIFEKQLEKCRVDYFDFYLFHNVSEGNVDGYLDEDLGIMKYLLEQKKAGRIKHLGFSTHGSLETMKRFLDAYGKYMEFCQIQLNYLDYTFQNAKEKIELIKSYGLPVWVMEPVRGGQLAKLDDADTAKLKVLRPDESVVAWAFRFLQTLPEVTTILSGMSNMEQLKSNVATFETEKPLDEKELSAVAEIAHGMILKKTLSCTACRYCTEKCPMQLDIPSLIKLYNEHVLTGGGFIAPMAIEAIPEEKRPSACLHCHSCEKVCPQKIKISDAMADFIEKLK